MSNNQNNQNSVNVNVPVNLPVDMSQVMPVVGKVAEYVAGIQNVKNFDEFLALNERVSGSPSLNVEKVGSGAVVGFVSGYAVRHTFKMAALFAGMSFISLQALNHFGYINVNWKRMESDARQVFDGKLESQPAVSEGVQKVKEFVTNGLPSTSGFAVGFLFGLRF